MKEKIRDFIYFIRELLDIITIIVMLATLALQILKRNGFMVLLSSVVVLCVIRVILDVILGKSDSIHGHLAQLLIWALNWCINYFF